MLQETILCLKAVLNCDVINNVKGSLHTRIFTKYTELLQLKYSFRNFEIIFEIF